MKAPVTDSRCGGEKKLFVLLISAQSGSSTNPLKTGLLYVSLDNTIKTVQLIDVFLATDSKVQTIVVVLFVS